MEREREREDLLIRMQNLENWELQVNETVCPRLAESKREFQRIIDDLFRPFVESGRQRNSFDWGCVKSTYNIIKNDVNRIWSLRICCVSVLELFCKFNCEDQPLIAKIISIYHQVLDDYQNGISFLALCSNCTRLNNPRHYFFEELKGSLSILSQVNQITARTYGFTNRDLYSKLTIGALYEGDYVFLKFLVKYGLSYFPDDELEEVTDQLKRLEYAYDCFKRIQDYDLEISERNFDVSVVEQLLTNVENLNIRRLILIVRYVYICVRRRLSDNYYPDYVKCLDLYVQTLPEAAISVKDVEDFLNVVFFDHRAFITEMCLDFPEVFQGSPSLSSPRSLQHLCRCTVRDSIQKHSLLPSMLSNLKIPKKIKDYLLILSD